MTVHIVKRKNVKERYDQKKVYASVYASCINCHMEEQECEKLAESIMKKINGWIKNELIVSSDQIKEEIVEILNITHQDVALMYKHHLDIC